jgi:hypothetical protein
MTERDEDTQEFSDEELEALAGEDPDQKAMATVNCDPSEFAGFGLDDSQSP